MEHRIFPRALQGLSSFEPDKLPKESSSGVVPESNALALKSPGLEKRNNSVEMNPFPQNFPSHSVDPICKINLRETSEFVRSFPQRDDEFTERWAGEIIAHRFNAEVTLQRKREGSLLSEPKSLDCPGTPSRTILRMQGAGESIFPVRYTMGSLTGKPFPSKWDDAEKWLQSSPCNQSPSNPLAHLRKINPNSCKSSGPTIESQASDTCRVNDLHSKELKHGLLFSRTVDATCDENPKSIDEGSRDGKDIGGGLLNMADVSSTRVLSSVLPTELNLSSSFGSVSSERGGPFPAFPPDIWLKDKFPDKVEPGASKYRFSEASRNQLRDKSAGLESMKDAGTQVVVPSVQHRDVGTEMTPLGSSCPSGCHTPVKNASPSGHNIPASRSAPLSSLDIDITELQNCHLAKLELQGLSSGRGRLLNSFDFKSGSNWSSREEEEAEISKSLRHFDMADCKKSIVQAKAQAWEEAERSKCIARYQREEARIEAWVNLQRAKAEAQSRELEVKIEKMRSNLEEKLTKKMAGAQKRAEEWRAAARAEHAERIMAASKRADRMRKDGNFHYSLPSCGCFACRS